MPKPYLKKKSTGVVYWPPILAKHAIPKTAEVAYSVGVGELGWQYGTGLKSHATVTNWCTERGWPDELHDRYFRSMMIKTCNSKDGGSGIFRWPFMGRDWVGVELLYNPVHWKFNQFWRSESWRNDAVEKTAPSRELGLRASGWATLENEKDTLLCPEELGRSICNLRSSLLRCGTRPIEWGTQWDSNSLLQVC